MSVAKKFRQTTILSSVNVNSLNYGVAGIFSGSASLLNNVSTPSAVTGLSFTSANIVSFTIKLTVSVTATSNMFEYFIIDGLQTTTSGWGINVVRQGDVSGITFTINSSGQILYTSSNIAGWTATTVRYSVTQTSATGTYTTLLTPTTGSYIINSMQIQDTTDAVSGVSNGGLSLLGGATVTKNLNAGSVSTANVSASAVTASNVVATNVSGTAITASNINATTITSSNIAVGTLTAGNLRVPGALTAGNLTVPGTLTVTNISVNNLVQSSGSINITGNSNTIGNIFTTGGNVGIGSTSPLNSLQIACNANTNQTNPPDGGSNHGITLTSPKSGTSTYSMSLGVDFASGYGYINGAGNGAVQPILLQTRNNGSVGGNVGIGTTAPSSHLHVNGSTQLGSLGTSIKSFRAFKEVLGNGDGATNGFKTFNVSFGTTYPDISKLVINITIHVSTNADNGDVFAHRIRVLTTTGFTLNVQRVDSYTGYSNNLVAHVTVVELN